MNSQPTLGELMADAKQNINFVALATDKYNFKVNEDKGKATGKWVTLVRDDENLLVNRTDKGYFFSSLNDNFYKGNVIDFLSHEHQLNLTRGSGDWKVLADLLKELLVLPLNESHSLSKRNVQAEHKISPVLENLQLETFTNRSYLISRGLEKVLDEPEFKQKIFNKKFIHNAETSHPVEYLNTAFPIENERGEIIGVNIHSNPSPKTGKSFKQNIGVKQEGLWISNVLPQTKVKELLISESPIDALSYHALKPTERAGERLYTATVGNISHLQPISLQRLIDALQPERLVLANDNEPSGIRFNLKLLGILNPTSSTPPVRIDVLWSENKSSPVTLLVDSYEKDKNFLRSLVTKVDSIINNGVPVDLLKAQVLPYHSNTEHDKIKIEFPNTRPFLERAEQFIMDVRGITQQVKIDRSLTKDWNDDLKASLTASKADVKPEFKQAYQRKI